MLKVTILGHEKRQSQAFLNLREMKITAIIDDIDGECRLIRYINNCREEREYRVNDGIDHLMERITAWEDYKCGL